MSVARSLLASRGARGGATWNTLSFKRSRGCTSPLISPPHGTQCPTESSARHRFGGPTCRRLCLFASASAVDGGSGIGVGAGGGLGRDIARLLRRERVPLVLHFDVNKTLIMVDPAGGKAQPQVRGSRSGLRPWVDVPPKKTTRHHERKRWTVWGTPSLRLHAACSDLYSTACVASPGAPPSVAVVKPR